MLTLIEIILCLAIAIAGALIIMIAYFLSLPKKHPCKGCKYFVKQTNQCTFNPIYGEQVPEQCQREAWSV